MPRRLRVTLSAPKATGARRLSFLKGKKSPRRTRGTFRAKQGARTPPR